MNPFRTVIIASVTVVASLTCVAAVEAQLFRPPTNQAAAGTSLSVVAGDLNGDGKADALVLNSLPEYGGEARWEVRLNDGAGNFTTVGTVASGLQGRRPAIADVDGDHRADVVIPSDDDVVVFWGDGQGSFPATTTVGGFVGAQTVTVFDINVDARPDLLVGDVLGSSGLVFVFSAGGRQFGTPIGRGLSGVSQITVGNANGDIKPDYFVSGSTGLHVCVLSGSITLLCQNAQPLNGPMAFADLNGDSLTDVVVSTPATDIRVFLSNFGSFGLAQVVTGVSPGIGPPHISDVNGDQIPDVIVPLADGTHAVVLRGHGDGQFTALAPFAIAQDPAVWNAIGDVNGDGAADILAGGAGVFSGGTEFAISLHVAPLRISAQGASATAGSDGLASVTVTASVESGPGDVSFAWFEAGSQIGSGSSLTVRLPAGDHTLTVRASTADGLMAVASAAVSIAPRPDATLADIRSALDERLDVTLSSRASASDLAAIATKIEQLQTSLQTAALTQAINALSTSLTANQTRIAIEQALARVDMIASFYLPASQGGQLDVVRSIVADVIDKSEAAGGNALNVGKARRALAEGDARKASGDYRTAYLLYAGAYLALGGPR